MCPTSRRLFAVTLAIAAVGAATSAAKKRVNLKDGQWETTIKMEMAGMPMQMPPVTTSSCITQQDLVPATNQPGQECKVTKQKVVGNTVEWAIACTDKSGMTFKGSGKATYSGDRFTGTMQMSMSRPGEAAMNMSYAMQGKRVGPCKKAGKASK